MTDLHVLELGHGPRVVLVHGSIYDGASTWSRQLPLADRLRLVIPDRRGYGGSPDNGREDFEVDAADIGELLNGGAHLVGHSYGGVVALVVAAQRPDAIRSLTVIEPPAFSVARDNPAVEASAAGLATWAARAATMPPEAYLRSFLTIVGIDASRLPDPLPPELARGAARLATHRSPAEAEIPLDALAAAPFPKLVVSGNHDPGVEAICDVLAQRLPAERAVIEGKGDAVQAGGEPFNERLAAFIMRAETRA